MGEYSPITVIPFRLLLWIVFLSIGLVFLIFTVNLFTETRQILLSSAIIGVGATLFGIILIQASILLYVMVKLMRNKKLKKSYF